MIAVPGELKGCRILLDFEMIQAQALVFVNGRRAGEVLFPGGMLDVTSFIAFGADNRLDILVSARPPKAETAVVMDVTNVFKADAKLRLKCLTGDVYLVAVPEKAAVDDIRFTSKTDDMTLKTEVSFLGEVPRGATLEVVFLDGEKQGTDPNGANLSQILRIWFVSAHCVVVSYFSWSTARRRVDGMRCTAAS